MGQTPEKNGRTDIVLAPLATGVVVLAAFGLMIVVAPRSLVEAAGLLGLRTGHGHAFGLAVLLLTAWASWIIGASLDAYQARRPFLEKVPATFDGLSAAQRGCLLACLKHPDHTIPRGSRDSIARSLCELGLLTPPPDDPESRLRLNAAYTMPADVAAVLGAHLESRKGGCRPYAGRRMLEGT